MTTRILVSCSPGEMRIAVVSSDGLLDYAIHRPGEPDGVGDVHLGRVIARAPAMAGAFVAIAGADGFLPDSRGAAGHGVGEVLAVRITRAAMAGKGPRLETATTADVTGTAPRLLERGPDALTRLAATHVDALVLIDDAGIAARFRASLGPRASVVRAAFDDALEADVAALADATVTTPHGILHIEPTRALTAIDLDAGSAIAVRAGKSATHLAANRALLPVLARQIRLRNLSGAIVVDFAGLSAKRRAALGPELAAALRADPLQPRLLGFTGLGLAEITRPRVHPPLHEILAGAHAAGLAALRRMAREMEAVPTRGLYISAAPAVISALEADADARADFQRRTGLVPDLRSDPHLGSQTWRLDLS